MAISVLRNLSDLRRECKDLNLNVVQLGKKEQKLDYITALRNHFLQEKFNGNIPDHLQLMLNIESPMLCQRYQVLREDEKAEVWKGKNWYFEEKEDGVRMIIICIDGRLSFYSRNISVTDYLPVCYTDNIYLGHIDMSKLKGKNFMLDSEVISTNPNISTVMEKRGLVTETQLQAVAALLALNPEQSIKIQEQETPLRFKTFDCLWFDNKWIIDQSLLSRRSFFKISVSYLEDAGLDVKVPLSNYSNRKAFYRSILFRGGEGVIAKNINSSYIATSSRNRDGWVKIKRSMVESLQLAGIGDTVDAFITGFEPGTKDKGWENYVGALDLSVFLDDGKGEKKTHMIARVTNLTMEQRKALTIYDVKGNPGLDDSYYGKVVEIDGQCVSARSKRLTHAKIVRWRPDKDVTQCVMDEDFLNSMIL